MDDDFAIKVENVSKSFILPHERHSSLKSTIINFRKRGYEKQRVLKSINFEIKKGEFFGIVGRNGSGKSTLLKMLAGIYSPDEGQVHTRGVLTPFIELGVGFNPELTGRENVFLNGALLGFSRKEMAAMYDDIVAFAEIEKFMDQKLKNYSSGMQVRLAFSIAIQAKSDILILDEVLAVGDEAFQQKCISVFEQYKANKQTIVLVTHDMGVVERFCSRALLLKDGEILKMGSPRSVAHLYSELNRNAYADEQARRENKLHSENIKIDLLDSNTKDVKKRFAQGEDIIVRLKWERDDVKHVGVALLKQSGEYVFGPNTYLDNFKISEGSKEAYYRVRLSVAAGEYYIKAGLFASTDSDVLEFVDNGPHILIEHDKQSSGWGGITYLDHSWGDDENVKL